MGSGRRAGMSEAGESELYPTIRHAPPSPTSLPAVVNGSPTKVCFVQTDIPMWVFFSDFGDKSPDNAVTRSYIVYNWFFFFRLSNRLKKQDHLDVRE